MIRSLRWRVQLWYGAILLLVVVSFGTILYVRIRATRQEEIDSQLRSAALYLDATLRSFPPRDLEEERPEHPPKPWMEFKGDRLPSKGKDKFGPKRKDDGFPFKEMFGPKKSREQWLSELSLPRDLERHSTAEEKPYFGVWRADGSALKAQALPNGALMPKQEELVTRPVLYDNGDYREAWMRGPHNARILVGRSVAREREEMRTFILQIVGIGAGVLFVGLAGGWLLASRIVKPIAAMSATAASISARHLTERIDAHAVDTELAELATVLNAMFARIESAFDRQQQFTADASHELRTPLAILRSHAELALAKQRSPEEYRKTLETCLRAANRMNGLVQGLLALARLDGGHADDHFRPLALTPLVEENVTLFQPLADEKKITLTAELSPVEVRGDPDQLMQVLTNLLHNAIQHTHVGGTIHVHLTTDEGAALLRIHDTGAGIPVEHRIHIFERFYRVDKSRARASGGAGLGLAICKGIIEAHQGTIGFDSDVNQGTTFWVRLPISA